MKVIVAFSVLLLSFTGCTSFRGSCLYAINDQPLHFGLAEDSIKNKYPLFLDIAIIEGDSHQVAKDYKLAHCYYRNQHDVNCVLIQPHLHVEKPVYCYYLPSPDKVLVDFATIQCYKKKPYRISLFSKGTQRIDSLLAYLEQTYLASFTNECSTWTPGAYYTGRYGNDYKGIPGDKTIERGHLTTRGVYIDYLRDYIMNEISIDVYCPKNTPRVRRF